MLSLFKLKKKSKKGKDQSQDDEKENTSSPTKVKKVEKPNKKDSLSSGKENGNSKKKSKVLNENKQQKEQQSSGPAAVVKNSAQSPKAVNAGGGKLDTRGLDSPYKSGGGDGGGGGSGGQPKPLSVDVTTTPIVAASANASKHQQQAHTKTVEVVEINSEPSPSSASSSGAAVCGTTTATGAEMSTPGQTLSRAPVLSASDAANTTSASFIRGNFLSSTISGSDLNRYLNSGYIHGADVYLQKPIDPKLPKSPHFHRPPNFSFYRNVGPNYVITPRRNANRVSSSSMSSNARSSRGQNGTSVMLKRVRSNSPPSHTLRESGGGGKETEELIGDKSTGDEPVTTRISIDNEEPIRLSKFSGGYEPDPQTPRKIESLDWPAPPYPAAVPELRARSRSSSNRHAHSTVHSVNGEQCLDDSESDVEEDVNLEITNTTAAGSHLNQSTTSSGAAVNSSNLKRPKSGTSKPKYRHAFFDNDYDDYLLQYRPHDEWRKHLNLHRPQQQDVNNNSKSAVVEEEELDPQEKQAQEKLKKEMEEIAKLENESSMAADLIKEIKQEQKRTHHKLKLDPWKASRTPNANMEPSVRTRYDSPVNASPSRIFYYNASGSHRIPTTPSGHTISTTTGGTTPGGAHLQSSTTASTSFFRGAQSTSSTGGSNSSTLIAGGPVIGSPSSSNNAITNAQSINYNLDSSSSTAALIQQQQQQQGASKSATLPASAQQQFSVYATSSSAVTSTSQSSAAVTESQRAHTLSNASTSPTIAASTPRAGLSNNIVYNIAVPKPGYGLSSPNKSVTLPNSARYAGMPTHQSVDFERRTASPLYDSVFYSPPSPRENYEIYPYETLKIASRKKLPVDVDRANLERHLSDDEFRQLFGMNLKEFYQLPYWKRMDMKKIVKLF